MVGGLSPPHSPEIRSFGALPRPPRAPRPGWPSLPLLTSLAPGMFINGRIIFFVSSLGFQGSHFLKHLGSLEKTRLYKRFFPPGPLLIKWLWSHSQSFGIEGTGWVRGGSFFLAPALYLGVWDEWSSQTWLWGLRAEEAAPGLCLGWVWGWVLVQPFWAFV